MPSLENAKVAPPKKKANILIVGNSGAGKSTLINSIIGEEKAPAKAGEAVTTQLDIFENAVLPFRVIDTVGFEFDAFKQWKAIHEVKKWSKNSIVKNNPERQIDVIWYCVEATSKKLFSKNIDMLSHAVSTWKHAPVIVVLTKSYSSVENTENIRMIYEGFEKYHKKINLKAVIPVVAQAYQVNEDVIVEPQGLSTLVEETNKWIPEGIQLSAESVYSFILKQKRYEANALIAGAAAAAGTVAAAPIPFADAIILTPLEVMLVTGIGRIYGINKAKKGETASRLISTIVEAGTVSTGAKAIVELLKNVNPVVKVANVIVASTIVVTIGEITIGIMDAIYTGKVDANDLDWVKKFAESEMSKTAAKKIQKMLKELEKRDGFSITQIPGMIVDLFRKIHA